MYDQFAQYYDTFVNWPRRLDFEMTFLLSTLDQLGPARDKIKILDSACATGQHATALAQEGFDVAGSDISHEMVSLANANAHAADQRIDFRTSGFGNTFAAFDKRRDFDAVLCLGNSLPHVESIRALNKCLRDFSAMLKSAGIVFIQMHNFDCVMQEKKRWMEPLALSRSGKEWVFMRFYDFEPNGYLQFNILTLEKEKHQPWKSQLTSTRLFPITSNLLDSALHESGFEDTSWYGSMAGDTFDNSASSDIVVIAKKKTSR